MYVKKTLGFTDIRVINKLEEIKLNGGNWSQYVTQLILKDIEREQGKYTIEELIEMVRMATITVDNEIQKDSKSQKNNSFNLSELMKSAMDVD